MVMHPPDEENIDAIGVWMLSAAYGLDINTSEVIRECDVDGTLDIQLTVMWARQLSQLPSASNSNLVPELPESIREETCCGASSILIEVL